MLYFGSVDKPNAHFAPDFSPALQKYNNLTFVSCSRLVEKVYSPCRVAFSEKQAHLPRTPDVASLTPLPIGRGLDPAVRSCLARGVPG